jgi:hypothetical protein
MHCAGMSINKQPQSKSIQVIDHLPGRASPISGSSLRVEMILCEYEGDSGGGVDAPEDTETEDGGRAEGRFKCNAAVFRFNFPLA